MNAAAALLGFGIALTIVGAFCTIVTGVFAADEHRLTGGLVASLIAVLAGPAIIGFFGGAA